MYIYIYIYIYIFMLIYLYLLTFIYTYIFKFICLFIYCVKDSKKRCDQWFLQRVSIERFYNGYEVPQGVQLGFRSMEACIAAGFHLVVTV